MDVTKIKALGTHYRVYVEGVVDQLNINGVQGQVFCCFTEDYSRGSNGGGSNVHNYFYIFAPDSVCGKILNYLSDGTIVSYNFGFPYANEMVGLKELVDKGYRPYIVTKFELHFKNKNIGQTQSYGKLNSGGQNRNQNQQQGNNQGGNNNNQNRNDGYNNGQNQGGQQNFQQGNGNQTNSQRTQGNGQNQQPGNFQGNSQSQGNNTQGSYDPFDEDVPF